MRDHTTTEALGARLLSILREVSGPSDGDVWSEPKPYRLPLRDDFEDWSGRTEAESLVAELTRRLVERRQVDDVTRRPKHCGKLGSRTITGTLRKIRRGYLLPKRSLPVLRRVPAEVVQFIIDLPGGKDFLLREHHDHVGWHYHYLDRAKRRTNVILSWDDLTIARPKPDPLFYERHAEGKAVVKARPELWKSEKRRSMHRACSVDLKNPHWAADSFRRAASDATAVWPIGAMPSAKTQRKTKRRR